MPDTPPTINSLDELKLATPFKEAMGQSLGTGATFLEEHPKFTTNLGGIEEKDKIIQAALDVLEERQTGVPAAARRMGFEGDDWNPIAAPLISRKWRRAMSLPGMPAGGFTPPQLTRLPFKI